MSSRDPVLFSVSVLSIATFVATTHAQPDATTTDAQPDATTTDAQPDATTTDAQPDVAATDAQPDVTIDVRVATAPSPSKAPESTPAPAPRPSTGGERVTRYVRHIPPSIIEGGEASLAFELGGLDRIGPVVVHVRGPRGRVRTAPVRRTELGWLAVVPAELVSPPWLEYWVEEQLPSGRGRAVFASSSAPHRVQVIEREDERREADARALRGGRESQTILRGEWVDFGRRRVFALPQRFADRYHRIEASYAYGFFGFVEQIRIGVGSVRGESVSLEQIGRLPVDATVGSDVTDVGVDYGVGEITWYLHELLRVRSSLLFGFSQEGFELGGGFDLVIGRDQGTSLTLGGELVGRLGMTGKLRLEWWTVPRFPMGAQVEVTTFPSGSDPGVRLLYDVALVLYPGALVRVRSGYQARTSITGGPALGAELVLAF